MNKGNVLTILLMLVIVYILGFSNGKLNTITSVNYIEEFPEGYYISFGNNIHFYANDYEE